MTRVRITNLRRYPGHETLEVTGTVEGFSGEYVIVRPDVNHTGFRRGGFCRPSWRS